MNIDMMYNICTRDVHSKTNEIDKCAIFCQITYWPRRVHCYNFNVSPRVFKATAKQFKSEQIKWTNTSFINIKRCAINLTTEYLNETFSVVQFSDNRCNIFYEFYFYTMTRNAWSRIVTYLPRKEGNYKSRFNEVICNKNVL